MAAAALDMALDDVIRQGGAASGDGGRGAAARDKGAWGKAGAAWGGAWGKGGSRGASWGAGRGGRGRGRDVGGFGGGEGGEAGGVNDKLDMSLDEVIQKEDDDQEGRSDKGRGRSWRNSEVVDDEWEGSNEKGRWRNWRNAEAGWWSGNGAQDSATYEGAGRVRAADRGRFAGGGGYAGSTMHADAEYGSGCGASWRRVQQVPEGRFQRGELGSSLGASGPAGYGGAGVAGSAVRAPRWAEDRRHLAASGGAATGGGGVVRGAWVGGAGRVGGGGGGVALKRGWQPEPDMRPQPKRVRVTNVPRDLQSREIREAFEIEAGPTSGCELGRGIAWVTFRRAEDAAKAVETFDGGELNGNTIKVSMDD